MDRGWACSEPSNRLANLVIIVGIGIADGLAFNRYGRRVPHGLLSARWSCCGFGGDGNGFLQCPIRGQA